MVLSMLMGHSRVDVLVSFDVLLFLYTDSLDFFRKLFPAIGYGFRLAPTAAVHIFSSESLTPRIGEVVGTGSMLVCPGESRENLSWKKQEAPPE